MSHFTTFLCLASLVNPFRSVTLLEKRLETLILIIAILLAFSSSNVYSQLNLFGLTPEGGTNGHGVIFSYDPVTNTYTKKHDFDSTNGRYASSSLFQASNGKLYGTTRFGGSNDLGVLFEYDPATSTYAKKFDFGGSDGAVPFGTLAQAADGNLYGTASEGGSSNVGVLFEYDPVTEIYTKKLDFDGTNGANPWNSLMKATNGKFYGTTGNGGTSGAGVIFEYDPATSSYTKLYDFDYTNGADPRGTPMQATNGKLYGVTVGGGASGLGVFWEFGLPSTYTKKFDFNGTNGSIPHHGPLLQATNGKIYGMTLTGGSDGVGVLFQYDIASDTDTTLVDFLEGSTNGNRPFGQPIQASNGKIYGVANRGGLVSPPDIGLGVIFEYDISTATYTKKFEFSGANGAVPFGELTEVALYTLTINATNGTVTKNPDQATYTSGTQVILIATPSTGYHFVNWSGDLSSTENPDTITMDGDKTITANFAVNCVDPDVPTLSATASTICSGGSTTLNVSSGNLNDATNWQWYSGSCGETSVGSGTSITVSPTITKTYYARGEGGCISPGSCGSIAIIVNPTVTPSVSIIATPGSALFRSTTENTTVPFYYDGQHVGQSFTTGSSSVQLQSISVKLYGPGNGGLLTIQLYQDDGTTLNSKSPIATSNTDGYFFDGFNHSVGTINTRTFSGVTLAPNTAYTFVLFTAGSNFFSLGADNTNPYAGGVRVQGSGSSCCPATGFSAVSGEDLFFSVNGSEAICLGTNVTFTATPTNGGSSPLYQWKKKGSNVGTNSATYSDNALANNDVVSCVMTSDATCASPTTATSNSITMTVNPTITPSVSISADPSGAILPGTPVTFTATPTNGGTSPSYQWKKNGSNVGTNSAMYSDNTLANGDVISCVMTSNAPCASPGTATSNTITAMLKYTLTVQATNGSVTKDPDQSSYNSGTQVQLTATPATGYHFVNWSGDLAGSENPDTLIMDGNKTVTANFAINTYTLTASAVGNGTITPSGNVAVQYGSSQSFTTSSDEGYHLDSIVVDGVRTDSLVSYTFYNVTGVHSITAYFSINYYALTTQVTGGGAITRTPPGDTYARGTEVTLVSTSNAHFNFSGWSGDTTGVVIRNDTLIVTMDVAKTIRANFAIVTYTITVTQGTNGTISPGTTTVDYGSNQTFTITPDSNYEIDRVPVDGNDVGKVTIYTFSNVTANRTLTAQFRPGTPLSSITVLVPNGNEIWRVGQTYTMSWSKVKVASVKVEYTIDSGRTWNVITSSTAATDTSWTIPDLPSGVTLRSARVRISSVTNSAVNDESDAQFIIQNLIQPSTSGTTRSLRDVAFSGQTGYVVGDSGTILKTTNGGQTWSTPKNTNLPANVNWKAIYLFDASICLVLGSQGNNAVLYSTFNGARSWSHENTINQIKANDIARAGGIGYIIVGDSGKISALATPTSAPPNVHLFGITSAGDSVFRCGRYWCANPVLYVVGANGTILRLKWTSQLLLSQLSSGVTTNLKSVSFININTGWVVGDSGTILKTTNGGTNWTQQASPTTVNLNGISMSSATSGWVVGDNGTILKYTPPTSKAKWRAGVQSDESVWTQVESGTTNDLTVASVTDNGSFVTVGDSGTALTSQAKTLILSSPTGGGNYIAGQSLPITWSSDGVEFVKIEYSADSGQTWLSVTEVVSASAGSYNWTTPGTTAPYVVVAITDVEDSTVNDASDSTFALVSDVAMFRTFKADTLLSKKGVTLKFDKLKNLTSGKGNIRTAAEHVFRRLRSMKGATFLGKAQTDKTLKKKLGWIALSTANQLGKMFTAPHTGTSYPIDSVRSPAPRKSKKLFGALKPTRKAYNNPAWEQGIIFRLNLIASSMGITPPGFGDLVLDTTSVLNGKQLQGMTLSDVGGWMDSVMTWWDTLDYDNSEDYAELAQFTSLLRNINEAFYDSITFSNSYIDSTAVIKGDSNLSAKILKPMNPFAMYLRGVRTASQSSGLLKYVLGSESRSVAIQPTFDEETEIPYEYELYQNYPNPFNPSTVIRYSLPVNGLVTLKVYNMLGQEVATILNNEEMESGEYELPFNATNFASGVYFYRINVESVDEDGMKQAFTDVKRMLMMK